MAYTSSSSSSSSNSDTKVSTCCKTCLKSYETLKEHYDNLTKDFSKSQFNLGAYKAGLESIKARLEVYKKNAAVFEDDIKILKLDVILLDSQQIDKSKSGLGYDSQGFDSHVLENHVNDKYNSGEGYHAVPPPYTGNYMPLKHDLVFADEHVVSESVTSLPGIAKSKVKTNESKLKNVSASIIEDWVSDSEDEYEIKTKSKLIKPSFAKVKFVKPTAHVKSLRKSVKQEESNRQTNYPRKNSQSPRGCSVTILNTLDHLGKFEGKADEGFLVGYSVNSKAFREKASDHEYILLPFMPSNSPLSSSTQSSDDKDADEVPSKGDEGVSKGSRINDQERTDSSIQDVNTAGPSINTAITNINTVRSNALSMSYLEETGIFDDVYDDREVGEEADTNNLELSTVVSPIPTRKVHKDHPKEQIIRDLNLATETRRMINFSEENPMVKQKDDGILISQDKYVADILKKFDFTTVKTSSTPIEPNKALIKDAEAKDLDVHLYRSMIGSLMYLTASRLGIMFDVCAYARDSPFDFEAFFDSDYAEASPDRKSTIRCCQFLGKRLILWQCKKQTIVANFTTEVEYVAFANCYGDVLWIQNQMLDYGFNFMNIKIYIDNKSTICIVKNPVCHSKTKHIEIRHHFIRDSYEKKLIQVKQSSMDGFVNKDVHIRSLIDGKKIIVNEASIRRDLKLKDAEGTACLPNDTIFEELARMGVMSHHKNIFVTPSLTEKVFANMKRKGKSFSGIITPLFDTMMFQASKEVGKGLEERITEIDADEDLFLINKTAQDQGRMNKEDLFGVNDLDGNKVIVDVTTGENIEQDATVTEKEVSTAAGEVVTTADDVEITTAATTPQISKDDVTLAQTLIEIKESKPKARGVIVQEPSKFRSTSSSQPSQLPQAKDKGKGIMVEPEKPLKKIDQIALDEEVARNLEAQMKAKIEKEERIANEKLKENIAVIEEWDDVQATIDVDRQLAEQLQAQEREQLSIEEISKLLAKLIESRRKYFASKRAEEIKNKPPTKAQQKSLMCTYLKNIEGYKQKDFKGKSFDAIKKMFGDEIEQENAKRQRLEIEDDTTELKRCLEIVPKDDDDVTIEATPLSSKSPTIVDYKIYKKRRKATSKSSGQMETHKTI
nr:putative ribonuclease H-like domain-containing protein [Tanacetum cinerariifolium]